MKRFSYFLVIALVALMSVAGKTVKAAASSKDPESKVRRMFGSLFSGRHKAPKKRTDDEEAIADEKRDKKHHAKLMVRNSNYRQALAIYRNSYGTRRFADPTTSAILNAHLSVIQQFIKIINALNDEELKIARHQLRLVLLDNAATKKLLQETLDKEAGAEESKARVATDERATALVILGFTHTDHPSNSDIRRRHGELFRKARDAGNTAQQQLLNQAKAALIPSAAETSMPDDTWAASAADRE